MKSSPSLILVTVDCLRANNVGFMGYDRPTTPFLDSLAAGSVVFQNAIAAGVPTYYSFPAILASRYPLALGRDVIGLAPDEPTIATVLSQLGYATAAFLAGNPYLSPRFGYQQGFDTFRDFLDAEVSPLPKAPALRSRLNRGLAGLCHRLGPVGTLYDELYFQYCQRLAISPPQSLDTLRRYPSADVIVDHAGKWLSRIGGRPFFLWLHFMDPHGPYYPPRRALELMGNGEVTASPARYINSFWNRGDVTAGRLRRYRDEVVALYDAGVRWVDEQVARLTETLRQLRLWDDCVFAVTADHGEEFLDHGGRYHHPSQVTEELVRVPLMLRVPGPNPAATVKNPFSLLHLAPTLLQAVGAPVPPGFRGSSLWPQSQNGHGPEAAAIVECVAGCTNPFRTDHRLGARVLAVREARYKLVVDFSSGDEQLFDLYADPRELVPLSPDSEKAVRRRLLERSRQHLADSRQSRDTSLRLSARIHELGLEWSERLGQNDRAIEHLRPKSA